MFFKERECGPYGKVGDIIKIESKNNILVTGPITNKKMGNVLGTNINGKIGTLLGTEGVYSNIICIIK